MTQLDHFAVWLTTPLGQYLAASESTWFDRMAADIFGYRAMQFELPQIRCLQMNRMPWRATAGLSPGVQLRCALEQLPLAEQSLDLIALPHVLDFVQDPHAVLREAARVLMPEGRLLITGFNPWTLWGLRRFKPGEAAAGAPWQGNALSLPRLKDWLALLGLETLRGEFLCYSLPLQRDSWLGKTRFLELAGDRWWPAAGGVYCLEVVKRVRGMRVIEPQWRRVSATKANPAAVAEKNTIIKDSE